MTLAERLQKARALIAGGWTGPELEDAPPWACCKNRHGEVCSPEDEGLHFYSTAVAVGVYAENSEQFAAMDWALASVATPTHVARDLAFASVPNIRAAPAAMLGRLALLSVSCIGRPTWNEWRTDPSRQLSDVLKVFDRAIQKLQGEN